MYVLDWEQNVLKPQTLALRSSGSCVIDELLLINLSWVLVIRKIN